MNIISTILMGTTVIGKTCLDNLPVIQTGLSLIGTVVTPIWTAKATLRAKDIIDAERAKRGPDVVISKGEMLELTWKEFIGPVISCGLTCACEVKTTKDLLAKSATATALAATSAKALQEYRDKNKEIFGESKDRKITDAVADDKVKAIAAANNGQMPIIVSNGSVPIVDGFSGRLFESTIEKVRKAVNDINHNLNTADSWAGLDQATLNEFYTAIDDPKHLTPLPAGYHLGWTHENILKVEFTTVLWDEQTPVVYMKYNIVDLETGKPVV